MEQLQQRLDEIVDKLISIGPEAVNATKKVKKKHTTRDSSFANARVLMNDSRSYSARH